MPIGNFSDCSINRNYGIVNEYSSIGPFDNQAIFYYPNRTSAQLNQFKSGYLEYKFPLDVLQYGQVTTLEFSFECCSEAPSYKINWPSDISLSVNNQELHTFTSPGDFGERKGKLNPLWWPEPHT